MQEIESQIAPKPASGQLGSWPLVIRAWSTCVLWQVLVLVSWNLQQVLLKYDITQAGCRQKTPTAATSTAEIFVGYLEMAPHSHSKSGEQTPKATSVARLESMHIKNLRGTRSCEHRKLFSID